MSTGIHELTDAEIAGYMNWRGPGAYTQHSMRRVKAAVAEAVRREREACAALCDEMHEHYSAYKDTALLNGDVELSNAASGEPRACEFLAKTIRARSTAQSVDSPPLSL